MSPRIPRLSLALLTVITFAACSRAPAPVVSEPTAVAVTTAVNGPASASLTIRGVLAFRDEMRLSFKVGGLISRIAVDNGAAFRKGQVLAEVEPTEINAQLTQAQQLDAKAARDLERGERLRSDEVISLEQLQNLRTQRELAGAQLRAAQFNRDRATIRAPADGLVLRRLAEDHELVQPGQPVLVVGSTTRGYLLRASVADRVLVQLRRDDALTVTLDAAPGQTLTGHISSLGAAADPASGLFPVEVELAPTDVPLASGMVASLHVPPADRGAPLVRVPASAIIAADGARASVFIVAGGKAARRAVQIAFLDGEQVALQSGVAVGENVVSAGAPYLDDGERVTVTATH